MFRIEGSPFIFHMRLIQLLSFPLKHTLVTYGCHKSPKLTISIYRPRCATQGHLSGHLSGKFSPARSITRRRWPLACPDPSSKLVARPRNDPRDPEVGVPLQRPPSTWTASSAAGHHCQPCYASRLSDPVLGEHNCDPRCPLR